MKIIFEDAGNIEEVQDYFNARYEALRSQSTLREFRQWLREIRKYRENHRNVDRVLEIVWGQLHKIAIENKVDLSGI